MHKIPNLFFAPCPGNLLLEKIPPLVFLKDAASLPAGPPPYHSETLLEHMAHCMNAVAGDPLAVWMALAHDAGKLTTPKLLLPRHLGHEQRGERLITVWAQQLRLPHDWKLRGCMAARLHMKAGKYHELRAAKKLDLLREVEPWASSFWKVVDADTGLSLCHEALADLERLHSLEHEKLSYESNRQKAIELLEKKGENL